MKNDANLLLKRISFFSCLIKMIPFWGGLIIARLLSAIVDKAVAGNTEAVISWGALLLGFVAATKIFQYLVTVWYRKKESMVVHNCKMNIYRNFFNNSLSRLYTVGFGDTKEKLTDDFQTVIGKYTSLYPGVISGIVTVGIYFSFLAEKNVIIAMILLGMSLILLIPPIIIKRFLQVNYEKCREIESDLYDFTVSGYRGFLTIKLYGLKHWWLSRLKAYHKAYVKIGNESIYAANAESTLMKFTSTIAEYGTYALLGVLILFHKVDRFVAVEAIALSKVFFSAIQTVFSSIPQFGVVKVAQTRLGHGIVSEEIEKTFDTRTDESGGVKGGISLNEVTYEVNGKLIYDHVTIALDQDKCYLVKGGNGVGKTTLFHLLVGLIPCDSGQISVGGYNPMELTEEFRKRIFYLAQEDVTFDLTPMEVYEMMAPHLKCTIQKNAIEFGLTEEQLQKVQLSELSGGERKKVYLSLAFAQNPEILFLDEPTNSLDKEGKQVLVSKLSMRSGSTWIISHDPVLDSVADAILYVKEGGLTVEKIKTK